MSEDRPRIPRERRQGIVSVFTGDGKGKTTAALGMALRAMGYGFRVLFVQFIKDSRDYGELMLADRFAGLLDVRQVGRGYVGIRGDELPREVHGEAARNGVRLVLDTMKEGTYDMIVLDELNVALALGLVGDREVDAVLEGKPPYLHLVFTGRGAPDTLVEKADLVTEMSSVRHPFDRNVPAQRGFEY